MKILSQKDIDYNTSYLDDRKSYIDIKDTLRGESYTFVFDDIIVNYRDHYILDDFQVSYEHKGATFICEYTIDDPSVIHFFDDEQIDVVKNGTNIYSGSVLEKGTTHTNFYKGKRTFAVSVIPTQEYMKKLINKDYDFSQMLYDELSAKTKTITPKRNLINAKLSSPIHNIINSIKEENIITDLIETWAKAYFLNLMKECVKPQNDLEIAREIIKINISSKLTLELASKELDISKRSLNKIFSDNGTTFKEYKKSTLHSKAKDMLAQGYLENDVYKKLKFSSLGYFRKFMDEKNFKNLFKTLDLN